MLIANQQINYSYSMYIFFGNIEYDNSYFLCKTTIRCLKSSGFQNFENVVIRNCQVIFQRLNEMPLSKF